MISLCKHEKCWNIYAEVVFNFSLQDDPCFLLHFDKVRSVTAVSSSAKYTMVRALVAVSDRYCQRTLPLRNFDCAYIKPTTFYSNRGDCVVLSQICLYACNLVCLSMCPVPLDSWRHDWICDRVHVLCILQNLTLLELWSPKFAAFRVLINRERVLHKHHVLHILITFLDSVCVFFW